MKHDFQQKQVNHEFEQLQHLQAAARRRNPDSRRRLDKESSHTQYNGNTLAYPLASKEQYSGNYEQGVTQLLLVGDTLLAISRGVNRKLIGSDRSPVDSVRVSILPVGDHEGSRKNSSVTLFETNPSRLNEPRADGVVKAWDEVVIGRDMLEAAGKHDPAVSRTHAKITVAANGMVRIEDFSTNGTQIFDEYDLQQHPAHGGLDEAGREDLAVLMQRLQENPHEWDKESAGQTVITGA